jgi:undecaprenyl-diphosphatase
MLTAIQSIVLGIVEGVTEFLPVSSTGHLILAQHLMGIMDSDFVKSFEIIIQLGAILAIVVLYWSRIVSNLNLIKKVIVAFIPTAVIGLIFYKLIKEYLLGNIWVVIIALLIGGIIMMIYERWVKDQSHHTIISTTDKHITYKQAFWVGVFQSIAVIPGVSRSGATIVGGELIGVDKKTIVDFSFILAIPTMIAASGYDLYKSGASFSGSQYGMLALGFVVSFISAIIVVRLFLSYIQRNSLKAFGIYRIIAAIVFALVFFH